MPQPQIDPRDRQEKVAAITQQVEQLVTAASRPGWFGAVSVTVHFEDGKPVRMVPETQRSVRL